jgi:hypothetical protein
VLLWARAAFVASSLLALTLDRPHSHSVPSLL